MSAGTMEDRETLKPFIDRLLELASRPGEDAKKELWAKHNALMPTPKSPVCVTFEGIPEKQWDVVFGENHLKCLDGEARRIEFDLKKRIWAAENVPDDHVVWPALFVRAVEAKTLDWGVKIEWQRPEEALGSAHIVAPFENGIDISRLKPAVTEIDEVATRRRIEHAIELTGGMLPVHPIYPYYGRSPIEIAVEMRGMEKIFFDVYDNPDLLHDLMRFITDAAVADHKRHEHKGWINCLVDPSGKYQMVPTWRHIASYLAPDFSQRKPALRDEWAYISAQSAMGLGPDMYAEFVHKYNCRVAELFSNGTVYYHGCECLDQKLDIIATLPNLRRHHVSPWSSVELAARKYQNRVNLEVHCHPGKVMLGASPDEMRQEIRGLLKAAAGHRMSLNLSDIHSLNGKPETLTIWASIAQDEVSGVSRGV